MMKKYYIGLSFLVAVLALGFLASGYKSMSSESSEPSLIATAPTESIVGSNTIQSEATSSYSLPGVEKGAIETTSGALKEKSAVKNMEVAKKTALLANGCFWCVESDLEKVNGVHDVVSGYAGGSTENPTYENSTAGGHREVVLVTYDANKVSFANLVEHIIKHGDPTDASGSFNDRGMQYAPAIYFETETERMAAQRVIDAIDTTKVFDKPLPLVIIPRVKFWPAEEYHQDYAKKNPVRYGYYRGGSGRNAFIEKYWGMKASEFTVSNYQPTATIMNTMGVSAVTKPWEKFTKPTEEQLRVMLTPLQYKVTQEEGTEPPVNNIYDKNYEAGIYVDIISGEPLYSSSDKFDSGTGWPSFVKPLTPNAVVLKVDNGLFSSRTEVRSRIADAHLGHVFDDGPSDLGGKRYCMNSAAMRFVPKADMVSEGYGEYIELIK